MNKFSHTLTHNPHNVLAFKRVKKNKARTFEHSEPIFSIPIPLNEYSLMSTEEQQVSSASKIN
jgi:hypothetical protein